MIFFSSASFAMFALQHRQKHPAQRHEHTTFAQRGRLHAPLVQRPRGSSPLHPAASKIPKRAPAETDTPTENIPMPRRFPPPWKVERIEGGYKVLDASGQAFAYVYGDAGEDAHPCRRNCGQHREIAGAAEKVKGRRPKPTPIFDHWPLLSNRKSKYNQQGSIANMSLRHSRTSDPL